MLADTGYLFPIGKSAVSQQPMMDRFEMVTTHSEQVLDSTMDRKEALGLSHRLESTHLAFLFTSVLVRNFSSIVLVLAGSVE